MDGPFPLRKGGEVPAQSLQEVLASARLAEAAVVARAVAREIRSYEPVHGVQVAPGEEVLEPAFDDPYVLTNRYGAAPFLVARRGRSGGLRVALPVVVAPGDKLP